MTSLRELLRDLEARGRVSTGVEARAAQALKEDGEATPWYLSFVMGAGACLATGFFLAGVFSLISFGGSWGKWAAAAFVFLLIGLGIRRFSEGVVISQLSFGLTLGGWSAGAVAGSVFFSAQLFGAALVGLLLAVLVYSLHPDAAPRFAVSAAALGLGTIWIFVEFKGEAGLARNLPIVVSTTGAALLLGRPGLSRALHPLAFAFAWTLVVTLPFLDATLMNRSAGAPAWPSVLVLTTALAVSVRRLLDEAGPERRRELWVPCLAAVLALGAVCWFGGPGLLAAILLLVLGHAAARRSVEALGAIALPVFLFLSYYDLQVSLLAKSGIVIGSGLVLLGLRHLLGRRTSAGEDACEL